MFRHRYEEILGRVIPGDEERSDSPGPQPAMTKAAFEGRIGSIPLTVTNPVDPATRLRPV